MVFFQLIKLNAYKYLYVKLIANNCIQFVDKVKYDTVVTVQKLKNVCKARKEQLRLCGMYYVCGEANMWRALVEAVHYGVPNAFFARCCINLVQIA